MNRHFLIPHPQERLATYNCQVGAMATTVREVLPAPATRSRSVSAWTLRRRPAMEETGRIQSEPWGARRTPVRCLTAALFGATRRIHRLKLRSSFEVQPIEGKGLGVVAMRNISQGEMILEDQPMLAIPCKDLDRLTDRDVEEMVKALPQQKQDFFWKLFDAEIFGDKRSAKSRVLTNSYPVEDASGHECFGVFNSIARFNHSCVPNVHNSWDIETQSETLYASRDIFEGQELCTSYLKPKDLYRSSQERRQLLQRLKFRCNCEACSLTGEDAVRSDQRRKELQSLTRLGSRSCFLFHPVF